MTGTFRRVGPAFVLTDDVAGIGSRLQLQSEWMADAGARLSTLNSEASKVADSGNLSSLLAIDGAAPLSPDRMRTVPTITWRWAKEAMEVATSELTPEWQHWVRSDVGQHNAEMIRYSTGMDGQMNLDSRLRDDRVRLQLITSLQFVVPGVGVINPAVEGGRRYSGSSGTSEPVAGPKRDRASEPVDLTAYRALRARVLLVTLADAGEAQRAVAEAASHEFTHLWVSCSPDRLDLIRAAVAAGKARGIRVAAVVPVLYREAATEAGRTLLKSYSESGIDLDILGESNVVFYRRRKGSAALEIEKAPSGESVTTGEWLRGDGFDVSDRVIADLSQAAAVPGLDALVLTRSAPPGYEDAGEQNGSSSGPGPRFGYGEDLRLAFLRKHSEDPIDISPDADNGPPLLPFFPTNDFQNCVMVNGRMQRDSSSVPLKLEWAKFRFQSNSAFLAAVFRALKAARPNLTLMLDDRAPIARNPSFFAEWDKPAVHKSFSSRLPPGPYSTMLVAGKASRNSLLRLAPISSSYSGITAVPGASQPHDSPQLFARFVSAMLESELHVQAEIPGIVIDLSTAPLEKALGQLVGFPRKE